MGSQSRSHRSPIVFCKYSGSIAIWKVCAIIEYELV